MKNLILFVLIFALPMAVSAKVLVGKVDIQKILVTVDQGADVAKKLKDAADKKQEILKKDDDKMRKAEEEYEKQRAVMNDNARAKKEKELTDDRMKFQQTLQSFQKELQDMENNFKKPILENIRVTIEDESKKAGVDVTFEVSTSAMVYAADAKDLTDLVIKAYNKKFPKK